ncbi:complement factor H-like [Erpetoichthys calabaricus]|uniref:Complement factor H-like n=1 Tax=Erpetoichthys calabaricus TaxID=27687 RepID=A0A8C4XAM0_ERPCA|nr:complement factor H-like [Erpetoichthys calabaricus]
MRRKLFVLLISGLCSACYAAVVDQGCDSPPQEKSAFVSLNSETTFQDGDFVTVTCHDGYSSQGTIKYQCKNKTWIKTSGGKCRQKQCGHPGDIMYGYFQLVEGDDFVFGAQVKYSCNEGYIMTSQIDYRVCLSEGWSNSLPHCEVQRCMPEKAVAGVLINSGRFAVDEAVPYGNVIKFQCSSPKLMLKGASEIFCKGDGTWSAPYPTCEEPKCTPPPDILNGNVKQKKKPSYANMETVEYTCDEMFLLEGSKVITCNNGIWTLIPNCKRRPTFCAKPDIHNGFLYPSKEKYSPGDHLYYSCDTGYKPASGHWWDAVQCKDGVWTSEIRCSQTFDCGFPSQVQNAVVMSDVRPIRDMEEIQYVCKKNYRLNPNYKTKCQRGQWTGLPQCQWFPVCAKPSITNGYIYPNKSEFREEEYIYFYCNTGFHFTGIHYAYCRNGKWDQEIPKCQAIQG